MKDNRMTMELGHFKSVLKRKIDEVTLVVHHGVFKYPTINIYVGDDLSGLNDKNMTIFGNHDDGCHNGWLFHETDDDFNRTCHVLADRINEMGVVSHETVADALWLIDIYHMDMDMDGESDNYDPNTSMHHFPPHERFNPDYVLKEYGIDADVFNSLVMCYNKSDVYKVCALASALHTSLNINDML